MTDSFGRTIEYLRLSVTQRCNLNCLYCGADCPDLDELTAEETEKTVKAFALCGIRKVRLTGGEPLVRSDIAEIAERVSRIDGIEKTALTTNGVLLKEYATALKKAGLDTVNISLDSLDKETYKRITGSDCLKKVLEGIDAAESAGLKVRINAVLMRGVNDGEALSLVNLAKDKRLDVRFIELMPFSDTGKNEAMIIKGEEILSRFDFLKPVELTKNKADKSVAKYYTAEGFKGQIGLISPVSEKFCDECNRIRLLSNGEIKPCLAHEETFGLRRYLDDTEKAAEVIKKAIEAKPKGHRFGCEYGNIHAMNKIGG